jgi:hypothetical protein
MVLVSRLKIIRVLCMHYPDEQLPCLVAVFARPFGFEQPTMITPSALEDVVTRVLLSFS